MRVRLLSYSLRGSGTALRIAKALQDADCTLYAPEQYCLDGMTALSGSLKDWAADGFAQADALVFCCAAGIAVRAIAPYVRSKKTDPAVVIVDELGKFSIPILSGHLGGSNELATRIAEAIGAVPVVTTATDLNGVFAVDVFAKRNHLAIESMVLAKEISATLLEGKTVGFCSDLPVRGQFPEGLTEGEAELGICVTRDALKTPYPRTLRLCPKPLIVGMGCRKNKPFADLEPFFLHQLEVCGASPDDVAWIGTVDLKKDEPGLLALCEKYGLKLKAYSSEELNSLPGTFSGSAFVKQTAGVDCVCERAAVYGGGTLIQPKQACDGMTFALAKTEEVVSFV